MRIFYDSRVDDYDDEYYQAWKEINDLIGKHCPLIIFGDANYWNRTRQAYKIVEDEHSFAQYLCYADDVLITEERGHCYLTLFHHDATDYFEVKLLTEKGREFFNRTYYYIDSRTLCERLVKSRVFSKLPHFGKERQL